MDGGLNRGEFPLSIPQMQKAIDIPLQLYAPYFCPNSDYFNSTSNWTSTRSSLNVTDCSYYGFQDVVPEQSRQFYDWFFQKGLEVGMVSFEPDFMNQVGGCCPQLQPST